MTLYNALTVKAESFQTILVSRKDEVLPETLGWLKGIHEGLLMARDFFTVEQCFLQEGGQVSYIETTAIDHARTLKAKGIKDYAWEEIVKAMFSSQLIDKTARDKILELHETTKEEF